MNRSFLTVVIIVIVLLALGAAVFFRDSLTSMFAGSNEQVATTTPEATPVWERYATSTWSIDYPPGYRVDANFSNIEFAQKPIAGVAFIVPESMATGTNLSSDSRLSVEWLPRAKNCTADIFINQDVKATELVDNGKVYSVASSTDAGAGNRYEQWVYAIKGSSPCLAVRYFIHSTAIENYPAGSVRAFDREQLIRDFDQARHSFTIGGNATTTQ